MRGEVETAGAGGAAATSGWGGRLGRYGRGYGSDAWRYVGYSFGTGLVYVFVQVLMGLYVLAVGYGESFLATQQLVVALCSAGFSVLAGVLVDRLGAKAPLLLSAGLSVLGLLLLVADPREAVILGASAVLGAGVGFYWVSQGPVLAQVAGPERRAGLFGMNWMFFTASGFAGGLLAGTLPATLGPLMGAEPDGAEAYRYTMWLGALALAGTAAPLLGMRPRPGTAAVRIGSGSWWRIEEPRLVAIRSSLSPPPRSPSASPCRS